MGVGAILRMVGAGALALTIVALEMITGRVGQAFLYALLLVAIILVLTPLARARA